MLRIWEVGKVRGSKGMGSRSEGTYWEGWESRESEDSGGKVGEVREIRREG